MDWDETLERVRSAADFCASSGLTRFRIEEKDFEIEVRRTSRSATPAAGEASATTAAAEEPQVASNGSAAPAEQHRTLKAEFVGIVRFARPAVVLGTVVAADRELAYVESLGIRNPVRSGGAGRITGIFVSDGEAVGFGQPLIAIEPQRV